MQWPTNDIHEMPVPISFFAAEGHHILMLFSLNHTFATGIEVARRG